MRARKDTKIELLRSTGLFANCSKSELEQIGLIADEIDLPADKTLITQGDTAQQFYVVIEGSVVVTKDGQVLPVRGGSEIFGEISLVSGTPATATVRTSTPIRTLVITGRDFKALLQRTPSIELQVLRAVSERLSPLEPAAE